MKVTLLLASTINGYIAGKTGNEDFISWESWFVFLKLAKEYGNFIVGRKAYENVNSYGSEHGFHELPNIKGIVLSTNQHLPLKKQFTIAASPHEALEILQTQGFKKALISGGSKTNTSFTKARLVDEIILLIEPVLVGDGLPGFDPVEFQMDLELRERKINGRLLELHYLVRK